jgi:hypothetical protein
MYPEALTGQRDARSVYDFGRILTDRIDSQSARNLNGGSMARRFRFSIRYNPAWFRLLQIPRAAITRLVPNGLVRCFRRITIWYFSSARPRFLFWRRLESGRNHVRMGLALELPSLAHAVRAKPTRTSWTLFFDICFVWRIEQARLGCSP